MTGWDDGEKRKRMIMMTRKTMMVVWGCSQYPPLLLPIRLLHVFQLSSNKYSQHNANVSCPKNIETCHNYLDISNSATFRPSHFRWRSIHHTSWISFMWFYEAFFGHFLMIKSHQRAQTFHPISPWYTYTYTYILSCSNPSLLSVLCGWIWLNLLLLSGHFRKPKLEVPWIRSMSGLYERIFSQTYGARIREFPSIFAWWLTYPSEKSWSSSVGSWEYDIPSGKSSNYIQNHHGSSHHQADHHHIPIVVGIIPYEPPLISLFSKPCRYPSDMSQDFPSNRLAKVCRSVGLMRCWGGSAWSAGRPPRTCEDKLGSQGKLGYQAN